ncbi:MAG TPA: molybdopterin-binding protein, partial [Pseudonocardia sp.]|nr:molybdopterin-binding protein [Pseudonocardia sp.]
MSTTAAPPAPAAPVRRRISPGVAALIGLSAVAAALGVGHLVAALIAPPSSPFLAVGDAVIRLSPDWLTEFAKTTFGTADKAVLLGGMAVTIVILAVLAGLASRERSRPGLVAVAVLGLAGVAAVLLAPGFAVTDLVAPAAALIAGVASFRLLHGLARRRAHGPAG